MCWPCGAHILEQGKQKRCWKKKSKFFYRYFPVFVFNWFFSFQPFLFWATWRKKEECGMANKPPAMQMVSNYKTSVWIKLQSRPVFCVCLSMCSGCVCVARLSRHQYILLIFSLDKKCIGKCAFLYESFVDKCSPRLTGWESSSG